MPPSWGYYKMCILDWINSNAPAIQALSGILLLLVTYLYVRLTSKLVHTVHESFLRPTFVRAKDINTWNFTIRNFGPGLALDVQLIGVCLTELSPISRGDSFPMIWWEKYNRVFAYGPSEIPPGNESEFSFTYPMDFGRYPVCLCWKSVTGRGKKCYWAVSIEDDRIEKRFAPLTYWDLLKFWVKWGKTNILTPFYELRRRWLLKRGGKR